MSDVVVPPRLRELWQILEARIASGAYREMTDVEISEWCHEVDGYLTEEEIEILHGGEVENDPASRYLGRNRPHKLNENLRKILVKRNVGGSF